MDSLEEEKALHTIISEYGETAEGKQAMRQTEVLNAKVTGLLTHVSVMLAVCTVMFTTAWQRNGIVDLFGKLLLLEIMGYLVITLLCLPVLFLAGYRSFLAHKKRRHDLTYLDVLMFITARRRRLYSIAIWGTVLVTVAFIITVAAKYAQIAM